MIQIDYSKVECLAKIAESFAAKNKKRITRGSSVIFENPEVDSEGLKVSRFTKETYGCFEKTEIQTGKRIVADNGDIKTTTYLYKSRDGKYKVSNKVESTGHDTVVFDTDYHHTNIKISKSFGELSVKDRGNSVYIYETWNPIDNRKTFTYDKGKCIDNTIKETVKSLNGDSKTITSDIYIKGEKYKSIISEYNKNELVKETNKFYDSNSETCYYYTKADGLKYKYFVSSYTKDSILDNIILDNKKFQITVGIDNITYLNKKTNTMVFFGIDGTFMGLSYKGNFELELYDNMFKVSNLSIDLKSELVVNQIIDFESDLFDAWDDEEYCENRDKLFDDVEDLIKISDTDMAIIKDLATKFTELYKAPEYRKR